MSTAQENKASSGAMLDPERSAAMGVLLQFVSNEDNPRNTRSAVLSFLGDLDELGDQGVTLLKDLNVTVLVNGGLSGESIAKVLKQHFEK